MINNKSQYSDEEILQSLRDARDRSPAGKKLAELIVGYAKRTGGLTLAFWQCHEGYLFDIPSLLSPEQCAAALKVPLSEIRRVQAETVAAVRPVWMATPEAIAFAKEQQLRKSSNG